ncbi:MAG TPA: nuclear transport factor 2 family protein [Polyangiaceae bacterium]
MTPKHDFTSAGTGPSTITAEVVGRFIDAFERKDPSAIRDLVATDCVMEAIQPAPNGQRVEGYEANVAFWQAMVRDPMGSFEVEDVVICGDRATNRWRYRFGKDEASSVRGVTLILVRDGKIAEALGYAKTTPVTALGQATAPASPALERTTSAVIQRFNEAFERHDPTLLPDLIAADCIIENSTPAPRGSRHVGKDACLELWGRLAGSPDLHFEVEEVFVADERAVIRWQLRWGEGENDSVRGVNVMRVRNGQIVEALGYSKGA